jgi:molybdenum cofactor biosynthesis enzyme
VLLLKWSENTKGELPMEVRVRVRVSVRVRVRVSVRVRNRVGLNMESLRSSR